MKDNCTVLLVEDDPIDQMNIKQAFTEIGVLTPLVIAGDGIEGLEILRNPDNLLPNLILLDLKMPKMDGFEFLFEIKNDDLLRGIPVVILTHVSNPEYVKKCYELGASGYIVKSPQYLELLKIIDRLDDYWSLSVLPDF
ncbi:MAG: response regulator [Bacteriovoracaceae bacterium]|nr:response regulator [Bacteriovoracaceae bacterium]